MQTVGEQLEAYLQKLIGVSQHFWERRIELSVNLDFKSLPLRLGQFDCGTRQRVEVQRRLGRGYLTGEADQACDQRSSAAHVLSDLGRERFLCVAKLCVQQQIGIAQHGSDGIIEFVRSPADQLSYRSQFFRLKNLRLQAFQIIEGFARVSEQAHEFAIEHLLAQKYHD